MTPERWRRIADLYAAAAVHESSERGEFLRAACSGDEALLRDVESLAGDWSAKSFLDRPPLSGLMIAPAESNQTTGTLAAVRAAACDVSRASLFQPGELIEHRFRIVREIARGGMAVVYEAFDDKLNQRIAIKRPLPGFGDHLPPEVRNALRVTHPNVCRTYEIHVVPAPGGDVDFLTMEFLEGETLFEKLGRDGPSDEDAVREIALQLCAGLEEAHLQGVIHGDLKSRNVFLTTAAGRLRVVITDFGLATGLADAATGQALPGNGAAGIKGTPGYMAPELWEGKPISVASDIYALGVVLHELVTGDRPRCAGGPSLGQGAERPRLPAPRFSGSPTAWDREILRCLEPEPARRFRSVLDVRRSLQRVRPRRWMRLAAALLVTLIASDAFSYDSAWRSPIPLARLAVGGFDVDPELRSLGATVRQDVSRRLAMLPASARLLVMPSTNVLARQVLTPAEARSGLGATYLLSGTLHRRGEKIFATATVVDTTTRLALGALASEYAPEDLDRLSRALAGTVTAALRVPGVAPESVAAGARRTYAQALVHLRGDDANIDSAIRSFEEAIGLDPGSALPYAGLAASQLREFELTGAIEWKARATDSVEKARARNPDAAPVHLAAAMLAHLEGAYDDALRGLQRALELQPENADIHRRLGRVYESMNRPEEAEVYYRAAVAAEPDYYKPYTDLGVFYYQHARYDDAAAAFRRVTELVPDVSLGHTNLGGTYANLGRYDEAEAEYRAVLGLKSTQEALENLAGLLAYERRDGEAIDLYERALAIPPQHYRLWMNIGDSYRRIGRSKQARDAYRHGETLAEQELRQDPRSGYARAFAAYFYGRLGDTRRALFELDQALRLSPRDARVLRRAALLYESLGQRDDAIRLLSTAPATVVEELSRHPDLVDLSSDPRFRALKGQAGSRPH